MPTVSALACILSVISAATRPGFTNPADFSATLRGVALPSTPMFPLSLPLFGTNVAGAEAEAVAVVVVGYRTTSYGIRRYPSIQFDVRRYRLLSYNRDLRQLRLALFFFSVYWGWWGYVFKSEEKKGMCHIEKLKK